MRSLVMFSMCTALRLRSETAGPIEKIITLLQDMQAELTEAAKKDQEVFESQQCYCESSKKEKEAAVAQAEKETDELASEIERNTALSSSRTTAIADLKAEVEAARKAIETATALREKEAGEFSAAEAELVSTLAAVTSAVAALAKHHGEGSEEVEALLQMATVRAKLALPGAKSYNSRSGQIFGMLKQMKETFEQDLSSTRADEKRAQQEFAELTQTKKEGIESARGRVVQKTTELTDANVALAQGKHDAKDTAERLAADRAFLADLAPTCQQQEEEHQKRAEERSAELEGVGDALKILTDDSARDLIGSALGLAQLAAHSRRARVVALLQQAASGSLRSSALALLASRAQLDAFTKVKAEIDKMIAQLKTDQEDEVEHRDWCSDEFRKNDVETKDSKWAEEDATAENNKLADALVALDEEIGRLVDETAAAEREVKHGSEDRAAANAEFQQTVADQRGAVQILTKVLDRLRQVYAPGAAKESAAAQDAQAQQVAGHSLTGAQRLQADAAFLQSEPYEKNQKSSGVLGLLEKTIADCKALEQEAVQSEQSQQKGYEKLVKELAAEIHANRKSETDARGRKAEAEERKAQVEGDLEATAALLQRLGEFKAQVHSSCDFVVANFDLRQEARATEVDSLEQAKAILSGASFR